MKNNRDRAWQSYRARFLGRGAPRRSFTFEDVKLAFLSAYPAEPTRELTRKLEDPDTPLTKAEFVTALQQQLNWFAEGEDEGTQPFEEWFDAFEEDVYAPHGP